MAWIFVAVTVNSVPRNRNQSMCAGLNLQLSQYFFRGLMIVIATGFFPLSPLSIVSTMVYVGKQPVARKQYCAEYWLTELLESMHR